MMRRPLNWACVGLLTGIAAACSSSLPASDTAAVHMCRDTDFAGLDDHGVGFRADGEPRLVRAYESTGRALNTWRWTDQEGPGTRLWPNEADSRAMAVCYFDGSFRTSDGRTYARALIETDGHRFQLVVADEHDRVDIMRPPHA
jgi:hypothetical protein